MSLKRFVIQIAVFVVGIVVMDLALSQIAKRTVPEWRDAVREKEARILVKPYHHGLRPYAEFVHRFGDLRAPFFTNSLGFRDSRPREVSLKRHGRRILVIGDSITAGVGIAYEKTFAGLIAKDFAKRGIETLNAAVQTYSHQIYYVKVAHYLEKVELEVSEVVVFVDIGDVANDAEQYLIDGNGDVVRRDPNCRYGIGCRYGRMKTFKFWLADNSIIYRSYKILKAWRRESRQRERQSPFETAIGTPSGGWTVRDDEYRAYGEEGLRVADDVMTRLADFLRRRNVKLTVVVYPWPIQIAERDLDSRQVRFWRRWAAKNGAGFIDLFPDFIDGRDPKAVYTEYFIPYDIHFSERGHAFVASKFLERYR